MYQAATKLEMYLNAHRYIYNASGPAWATGEPLSEFANRSAALQTESCEKGDAAARDCLTVDPRGQLTPRSCLAPLPARFVCKLDMHSSSSTNPSPSPYKQSQGKNPPRAPRAP